MHKTRPDLEDWIEDITPGGRNLPSRGLRRGVAYLLFRQGFSNVANIAGGIDAGPLDAESAVPHY